MSGAVPDNPNKVMRSSGGQIQPGLVEIAAVVHRRVRSGRVVAQANGFGSEIGRNILIRRVCRDKNCRVSEILSVLN